MVTDSGVGFPLVYFNRSRILSRPACAQLSSNFAPGAPAAPIPPMTSSPNLIDHAAAEEHHMWEFGERRDQSSPLACSARASVSLRNEIAV